MARFSRIPSAVLGQMKGRGFSFRVAVDDWMAASSSLVERVFPSSHLSVSSANDRSVNCPSRADAVRVGIHRT